MNYVKIIKDYLKLSEELDDSYSNIICYETKNGRRIIRNANGEQQYMSLNKNLQKIDFNGVEYYSSPLELIERHFTSPIENLVEITNVIVFKDLDEAIKWLRG